MSATTKARIAISMGDPAGIGPELCCRLAGDKELTQALDLVVYGHTGVLKKIASRLQLPLPDIEAIAASEAADEVQCGAASATGGRMALAAIEAGIDACLNGSCQALVTAPINKQAIALAGCPHPGHTELLAERCQTTEIGMLLYGAGLAVVPVTIHTALRSALVELQQDDILAQGRLLATTLRQLLGREPQIAVLGCNPHASDGGRFGDEEERLIAPAIQALQTEGIQATGPLSPDAAFTPHIRAYFDGHLCMYHDQGLIPFKALAFDEGVNMTMGLPIIRTSPDHGTAYDIAWKGEADTASMKAAVLMAAEMIAHGS